MDQEIQSTSAQAAMRAASIFPAQAAGAGSGVLPPSAGVSPPGHAASGPEARTAAELRLMRKVFGRCGGFIQEVCRSSSIRAEFLGALTANESGGEAAAVRFEPSVYRHLKAVAAGERPRYGGIDAEALCKELMAVLHPKTGEFHAVFLNSPFMNNQAGELARRGDEALRELASSWGYVQIMGFHLIGRRGTVQDLVEPRFHYRLAAQLLSEFSESYQLDLTREYEELFRCWNTGQPDGKTADPAYVERGLMRMELYRALAEHSGPPA